MLKSKELLRLGMKILPTDGPLPTKCWEWQGCKKVGYGQIKIRRLRQTALSVHRVLFAEFNDSFDLFGNTLVCHQCDNPTCCNPEHMFEGSYQDNSDDMITKGRARKGDRVGFNNGNNRLLREDLDLIMKLLDTHTNVAIAKELDNKVTHSMISTIRRGKAWSSYTGINAQVAQR